MDQTRYGRHWVGVPLRGADAVRVTSLPRHPLAFRHSPDFNSFPSISAPQDYGVARRWRSCFAGRFHRLLIADSDGGERMAGKRCLAVAVILAATGWLGAAAPSHAGATLD